MIGAAQFLNVYALILALLCVKIIYFSKGI